MLSRGYGTLVDLATHLDHDFIVNLPNLGKPKCYLDYFHQLALLSNPLHSHPSIVSRFQTPTTEARPYGDTSRL